MFDDDELPAPKPSRERLNHLLIALAVALITGGVCLWGFYRPSPPDPPLPLTEESTDGRTFRQAELEAKKLPEYVELRVVIKRELTDAEITRAIELTQHPNAWIRLLARGRLAAVQNGPRRAEAVRTVATGLSEESLLVRTATMSTLSSMKAKESETELRVFLTSPVEDERCAARHALRQLGLRVD